MPAHRVADLLQLTCAAALLVGASSTYAGGWGAAAGAAEAMNDWIDQQMQQDAQNERLRLQYELEMKRIKQQYDLEEAARERQRQRNAAEAARQRAAQDEDTVRVEAAHPGWRVLVNTSEFGTWMKQQPQSVRALAASPRAADAILLLDLFKRDTSRAQAAPDLPPPGDLWAGQPQKIRDIASGVDRAKKQK